MRAARRRFVRAPGRLRPVAVPTITGPVSAHSAAPRCGRALAGVPFAPNRFADAPTEARTKAWCGEIGITSAEAPAAAR